jgi:hypothetical protein
MRFFCKPLKLWRLIMSVESKLDAILAGQAAILTAVQNQPGTNNQAVLDGLAGIKTELDSVSGTIGTEAAPAAPAAPAA